MNTESPSQKTEALSTEARSADPSREGLPSESSPKAKPKKRRKVKSPATGRSKRTKSSKPPKQRKAKRSNKRKNRERAPLRIPSRCSGKTQTLKAQISPALTLITSLANEVEMPTSTPRHRQVTHSRLVNNISLLKVLALFSSALFFIRAADAQLRLAVLEIQGNVGGIAERQAWTDVIRASAISSLATTNISVIDREQFKLLVNPKKNLSDCADLCVVQLTRELGAKWSLSSS